MIEQRYTNRAGFEFILYEGNPFVEVFRKGVDSRDCPFEVIALGSMSRSEGSLKTIANSWSEYSKKV